MRALRRPYLLAIAIAIASPAAAELAAEFELPHPIARPDPFDVVAIRAGAGPDGWLVTYAHDRSGPSASRFARIDSNFVLLDPVGIEAPLSYDVAHTVVANQNGWLVVSDRGWVHTISASGVAGPAMLVPPGGGAVRWARAACGTTECLVTWWRFVSGVGHSVQVGRLVGDTITAVDLPVTTATTDAHEPAIAFDGTNYLVVWRDIRRADPGDIYGAFLSPTGELVGSDFPIYQGPNEESSPAVAWDGTSYFVVWRDGRGGTPAAPDLYGTRVTPSGMVLDGNGILVEPAAEYSPSIAWNGAEYVISIGDTRHVRTTAGGMKLGTITGFDVGGNKLAVAGRNGELLIAYAQYVSSDDDTELLASRMIAGTIQPPIRLGGVPSVEMQPAAAADSSGLLIVWHDRRDGAPQVFGMRVTEHGMSLDGTGFAVSPPGWAIHDPAVAFGNGVFLAAWIRKPSRTEGEQLEVARIDANGMLVDTSPIVVATRSEVATSYWRVAVSWNGESFLIVWNGWSFIMARRVSPTGEILDGAPIQISAVAGQASGQSVAWNGNVHVVAWNDHREGNYAYGARVASDGRVLDPENVQLRGLSDLYEPVAIAGGPHGFLLSTGDVLDIDGLPTGQLEPFPYVPLAWDGASYVALRRAGPSFELAHLDSSGSVVAQSTASDAKVYGSFVVASSGGGRSAVFYEKTAPGVLTNDPLAETHLYGRSVIGPPPPDSGMPDGGTDDVSEPTSGCGGCSSAGSDRLPGAFLLVTFVVAALRFPRRCRATLLRRSHKLLDQVAKVMVAHPEITKIRVEGHTTDKGKDTYNLQLSQKRADAVKAYLVKNGVDAARLDAEGFGETMPLDPAKTSEARAANRRVEFKIVPAEPAQNP